MRLFKFLLALSLVSVAAFVCPAQAQAQVTAPPNLVILYSANNPGELSVAQEIALELKAKDPQAQVTLKDVREFSSSFKNWVDQKIYLAMAKFSPKKADSFFKQSMTDLKNTPLFFDLSYKYDKPQVIQFLKDAKATTVISTNRNVAQFLVSLRENRDLPSIAVGWIHLDYFEGFLPRISKGLDKTFLPHAELAKVWAGSGIDLDKIATAGLPLRANSSDKSDRAAFLRDRNLDPTLLTIVISVHDQNRVQVSSVINNIKNAMGNQVQFIVPQSPSAKEINQILKNSDLLVTDFQGKLSAAEGFSANIPTVIISREGSNADIENAKFFESQNLALVNRNILTIGQEVRGLLTDNQRQEDMRRAQADFKNGINLDAVVDFATKGSSAPKVENFELGIEGGTTVRLTHEALQQLEADSPADVEIILSFSIDTMDKRFNQGADFGHLAVSVDGHVYTSNHLATPQTDDRIFPDQDLESYIYGIKRNSKTGEHASSFGMSYGRDDITLRVRGLKKEQIEAMHSEAAKMEAEWREGKIAWNARANNCADMTVRILEAGGLVPSRADGVKHFVTMPLDVFDRYVKYVERQPELGSEMVTYTRIPGSMNKYRFTRFPVSIFQFGRLLRRVIFTKKLDPMMARITKRIAAYPGDDRVYYEDLSKKSPELAPEVCVEKAREL